MQNDVHCVRHFPRWRIKAPTTTRDDEDCQEIGSGDVGHVVVGREGDNRGLVSLLVNQRKVFGWYKSVDKLLATIIA